MLYYMKHVQVGAINDHYNFIIDMITEDLRELAERPTWFTKVPIQESVLRTEIRIAANM